MISMIVAVDKNMGIGKNNQLLAHISPDLKYFKRTTKGHSVVMGFNTFESLPTKPLPYRNNIIITRKNIEIEDTTIFHSIEEFLEWAKEQDEEIFVMGGASIYKQLLPHADKLYITHIMHEFEADTFFPEIDKDWKMVSCFGTSENLNYKYRHMFAIYERK